MSYVKFGMIDQFDDTRGITYKFNASYPHPEYTNRPAYYSYNISDVIRDIFIYDYDVSKIIHDIAILKVILFYQIKTPRC